MTYNSEEPGLLNISINSQLERGTRLKVRPPMTGWCLFRGTYVLSRIDRHFEGAQAVTTDTRENAEMLRYLPFNLSFGEMI